MPIRRLCRCKRNGPVHGYDRTIADGIIQGPVSEVLKEFQERVGGLVAFLLAAGRGGFPDRFLLLLHVGVKVGLGAGEGFVPEPEGDHGDVDPGEQEPHGGGVLGDDHDAGLKGQVSYRSLTDGGHQEQEEQGKGDGRE
jgi:hypothetical protein